MSRTNTQKNQPLKDWHRADIICALRKAGWSLRGLSRHHGYSSTTLKAALDKPWPKGQRLIAIAIGIHPSTIWPSRYKKDATQTKKNRSIRAAR